jgi:four helix bundle protein
MEKPHKRLDVWNMSMDLVVQIYKDTGAFPAQEQYALPGQIRRAATSVPSNIAEGAARQTAKEFVQFLHVAQGSMSELDTLLELGKRLAFLPPTSWKTLDSHMERIDKMLSGLIRHQKHVSGKANGGKGRRGRRPSP